MGKYAGALSTQLTIEGEIRVPVDIGSIAASIMLSFCYRDTGRDEANGRSAGTQSGMAATSGTTIPKRSPMAARLAACRAIEETVSVGPGSARVAVVLAITVAE